MRTLFILNDAPYRAERPYNALHLANALAHEPEQEIRVFLMGDAVFVAPPRAGKPKGVSRRINGPANRPGIEAW